MSDPSAIEGCVLTPEGWVAGRILYGVRIKSVDGISVSKPEPPFVLPGFVDCHVHGGGGADMMEGAEAIRTAARLHARHGTTAFCATSVTAPCAEIAAFLDAVAPTSWPPDEMARREYSAPISKGPS